MRLAEFVAEILKAQGAVLMAFTEELGRDTALKILDEWSSKEPGIHDFDLTVRPKLKNPSGEKPASFEIIESTAAALKLPHRLEDHLWNYPHYRVYIESDLNLDHELVPPIESLIDEALRAATNWLERLGLSPEELKGLKPQSEAAWLRFRSSVKKQLGQRTLNAL